MFSFYVKHIAQMLKIIVLFIYFKSFVELLNSKLDFVNCLKLQFLYETLMRRNSEDCFCSKNDTKCWWHGLKDVKVTSSMKIDENVDFKTLLELLATVDPHGNISFRLEF
jgi:hypothetical protein